MMIQDKELRDLYQTTGIERLQKLQTALLQLEQEPDNATILDELRGELHSLKGDSRSVGLDAIATLATQIESIIKAIQRQEIGFTLEVSDRVYQGLDTAGQLLHEAVTGEVNEANLQQTSELLESVLTTSASSPSATAADTTIPTATADTTIPTDTADTTIPPAKSLVLYIEDDELREIYFTTSEGRLQVLEVRLRNLEEGPIDAETIEVLRRETHSLKGDSKAVGLDPIAKLAQVIEDIVKDIQQDIMPFTESVRGCLQEGLRAIRQLVYDATLGEPTGVNIDHVFQHLMGIASATTSPPAPVTLPEAIASPVMTPSLDEDVAMPATVPAVSVPSEPVPSEPVPGAPIPIEPSLSEPLRSEPLPVAGRREQPVRDSLIADAELREIYRTTSQERLQRLETNLLHLEKNPQDSDILATLMREAHSLKGDSRSTGVTSVETIAHAIEDVLTSIQDHVLELDAALSDRLYQGLDAMGQLVWEAVTGEAANIDTTQLIGALRERVPLTTSPEESLAVTPSSPLTVSSQTLSASLAGEGSAQQLDSVRVQTRDLDALMAQAEDLAVTRIQIAQTSIQTEQLITLWEEWKTQKQKPQALELAAASYEERLESLITSLRTTVQANSSKLEIVAEDLRDRVRKLQLLPIASLFQPLPRLVRDLTRQQAKTVDLILEGEETKADKRLLEGIKDSLMHLVRNAIDHGIESPEERAMMGKSPTATLRVKAYQTALSLVIEITDDGQGLDIAKIKRTAVRRGLYRAEDLETMSISQIQRLVLAPGFSTRSFITEISGRGVGLDVLRTQVERLKGSIQIESTPGEGCTFRLQLSTALSTANVVLVDIRGMTFALPIEFLQMTVLVSADQITTVDGQDTIDLNGESIPVADLADILELENSPIYSWAAQSQSRKNDRRPCVLLKIGDDQAGFFVDRLIAQQEVVSKPLNPLLKRVRNVTAATTLGTGDICMILNPPDLLKSLQRQSLSATLAPMKQTRQRKPIILLVEDSPPVRIQEKRLFEGAGYDVVTATNGLEGYNKLKANEFDAVVSDVEMPYLDGFSLVAKIREHSVYEDLPIILVTTLDSDEDRKRGADAGANAYIVKGKFNQEVLLGTLERLI